MFLSKVEAALGQTINLETDVKKVDFTHDDLKNFFAKHNIPANTDTDYTQVEGKLKWQVVFTSGNKGIETVAVLVPNDQKLKMTIAYYVGDEGDEVKEISEEIVLKNIKVEMYTSRHISEEDNKLLINLRLDDIVWDESGTLIRVRAGS
jgi:hypothetical protein